MPRSNRRSQQPYVAQPLVHNGSEGYYIFVPSGAMPFVSPGPPQPNSARPTARQSGLRIEERIVPPPATFKEVAEEWFRINHGKWVDTYRVRIRSRMDEDLLSYLGEYAIAEIRPVDVLAVARRIEGRGAIESAKRIMNIASQVFRFGVATGACTRDPTADIKGALRPPLPPKRRTALPAKELPDFMEKLAAYEGEETTRLALQLLVLTFVRTGEMRFAQWSEFEDLGSGKPLWRIPAKRMKLRRAHLVPLAPDAVSALEALRVITGRSPYLFPAATQLGVISENTLLYALYRMGYHNRATVHGFRATASTVLNEAQFNRDWIEMQLAHCDGSIRGVYNAAEWLPGRRGMMNWWADYVSGRVTGASEPLV